MQPIVRVIGKILRLVGISSPEDSLRKPVTASDSAFWRRPSSPKIQGPSRSPDEDGVTGDRAGHLAGMTQ